jgi:subtilisin family serine protease
LLHLSAGHGTHVAGIVGARNGGAGGIVGIAPGVGIFSIKILDAQGVGERSPRQACWGRFVFGCRS